MSHFAVLVVGEDIAKQLQPYHEFECTGIDDQYVQEIDVTEECKKHGLDWYGLEDKTVTNEAQIDRKNKHKYGFAIIDNKGNLVKAVNRTNPNKKWDWWTIGGRWSDYFLLKDGTRASYGLKKEIDFAETMKVCTFAVVKESQWYEKGEMGWWAIVNNQKDLDVWRKEFHSLIENLSEETLLTIVDCHI